MNEKIDPRVVLFWIALIGVIILLGIRKAKKDAKATGTTFAKAFFALRAPSVKAAVAKGVAAVGMSLDAVIYRWNKQDVFTRRDLLRSVAIFGASGSGKSSGSGYQLGKAIVSDRMTSGLILASKPEDCAFFQAIFAKAGRSDDLLIFGPGSPLRYNLLAEEMRSGADSRDITKCLLTLGETLSRGQSGRGSNESFWEGQKERVLYNAVEVIRQSGQEVSAPNIQRFITGAATSQAMLSDAQWQQNYHNRVFAAAHAAQKNATEEHDYQLARDFFLSEGPSQDAKLRGSVLADVMGVLHTINTGIVRELLSTTSNVSPRLFDQGKWILVDMPESRYGAAGALVLAAWKYATQRHVLRRKAKDDTPITVLWSDEYQKVANSPDAAYLAECRSHRGCMVVLTQSIHSLYSAIQGTGGEHQADALLSNFYHTILHACDPKTAEYAVSKLGKRLRGFASTTVQSDEEVFDTLTGKSKSSASYSERYENVLQSRVLSAGNMRSGGKESGYMVDGYLIRSEPFADGKCYLKVAFSQK